MENLNAKLLVSGAVRTGVYLDHGRHSAIVVKVKDSIVYYLTFISGSVTLERRSVEAFTAAFNIQLYMYPLLRAARRYAESGLAINTEARTVLRALLRG